MIAIFFKMITWGKKDPVSLWKLRKTWNNKSIRTILVSNRTYYNSDLTFSQWKFWGAYDDKAISHSRLWLTVYIKTVSFWMVKNSKITPLQTPACYKLKQTYWLIIIFAFIKNLLSVVYFIILNVFFYVKSLVTSRI